VIGRNCVFQVIVGTDFRASWAVISGKVGSDFTPSWAAMMMW